MEPFSVSTQLNMSDWRALQRALHVRSWSPPGMPKRLLIRAPMILIFVMLIAGVAILDRDDQLLPWVAGILATLLLVIAQTRIAQRNYRPNPKGLFLGPTQFDVDQSGLHVKRNASEGHVAWSQVNRVELAPSHIFLWVDEFAAYAIPARDLPAGLNTITAAERIRAFVANAAAANASPDPGITAPVESTLLADTAAPTPRVTLADELRAVGKTLLLLPDDGLRLTGSDLAIALLGAIALVLWLPLDPLIVHEPLQFAPDAITGLVFVIAGALALAFILARLARPRVEYRRSLLIVTASMFIAIVGSTLVNFTESGWHWAALLGATTYATLFFKQAFRSLTGDTQQRALLVGALATIFFVLFMDRQFINPSLWIYAGDDGSEADGGTNYRDAWQRMADLQFEQQSRIEAEVEKIATHSAAGAQVYFLGFAGVGEERVFAEEIALAAKRVEERYATGGRQLRLVNDRRDLEKYPLATARALRHALVSLGKVMDADDVLFLSLSSHGDDDATLSVSNTGMMPAVLDAATLANALEESGIEWKVIVISACHAGSFIESLADEHTIVLTASAADRTSFGCSDDRDLTYFGEAFYRDALPKAKSLREAFDAAKSSIAQREKVEGVDASDPQAHFGAALAAKLEAPEPR